MNRKSVTILLLITLTLLILGQLAARAGAQSAVAGNRLNGFYLLSYLCLLTRGFLWVMVLRKSRLIWAYPLLALAHPVVLFFSHLLFDERVGVGPILGAVMIVVGVSLVGIGGEESEGEAS